MNKLLALLFCCFTFFAKAQNSTIKKAEQNYESAQQYLAQHAYEEAIKHLDQAVKLDSQFQKAFIQLGDIYKRINLLPKAVENYQKAIALLSTPIEPRIYFTLGESQLLLGIYDGAKSNLLQFQEKYTGKDVNLVTKTRKYLADCAFAKLALKNPVKYELINVGPNINSENRDYFPALTADGGTIIFSRVIKGNEDFYTAAKKDGKWLPSVPLSANINTPIFNEGAQSISPDGKYLFFTGCNRPDGLGRCDIYLSKKEGKTWGKAKNLGPTINSAYWESQPSISADGNTLFFVSNRPGGIGGYDIWKTTLNENSQWTAPVNLGPSINTVFDEITPFIHPDGKTLYFSSDGWPGMGNKDIFFCRIDGSQIVGNPQNLGYPINTFNEEIGLIVSADGKDGLFSSNLAGGVGDLDIYSFKLPDKVKPLPTTYLRGVIRDKETNTFLAANVLVVDLASGAAMFNDETSSENGDFLTVLPIGRNYSFNVNAPGYLFYSQNFNLREAMPNKPYEVEILLEKIKVGLHATLTNIFFETNQYHLLPSSIIELDLLADFLHTNATIEIEIQGHTDNIGDLKLNRTLSDNRAKEVFNYLIKSGISGNRLTYKGFGSTKPSADNSTEQGRQANRRTEFIVTKI
jgi:outer membrane protein OmpA-like peptidoglycan-associated protein